MGKAKHLFVGCFLLDGDYWSKDFFLDELAILGNVRDDGQWKEEAGAVQSLAARPYTCRRRLGTVKETEYAFELALRDYGAKMPRMDSSACV
ncbi:hypothetical protein V3C33_07510 [Micrococcaceae bacterium Sec5.7]